MTIRAGAKAVKWRHKGAILRTVRGNPLKSKQERVIDNVPGVGVYIFEDHDDQIVFEFYIWENWMLHTHGEELKS